MFRIPLTKTQKRSLIFWILYNDYAKTQAQIADFLNVQQSTVSNGLKEANYLNELNESQKEIKKLRAELAKQVGLPKDGLAAFLPEYDE